MAAEPILITERDEDIHTVIREILRLVRKHDELLEEFRPLLDKYTSNPAAKWRRRAVPQDRQG